MVAVRSGTAARVDGVHNVELYWTVHERSDLVPLMLINGLGSPHVAFDPGFVAELNSAGCAVLRFDNRDVGKSSRLSVGAGYNFSDMAADAVAVLDAVGWPQVHVVGQSMGGMVAQQLAIDRPDRVLSLVALMSSSGEKGYGESTDEAMAAFLQPSPRQPEAWLDHWVRTERVWASPEFWDESRVRANGLAMQQQGIDPKGAFRQFRAMLGAPSRDDALARLELPALVVHGSRDPLVTPSGGRHLAEVIPGARYVEIDKLGHDLPPELWSTVAGHIADFVIEVGW